MSGFAAGLMLCCATTSFTLMPVPDALCIIFACPVVTIFLSALVLRDGKGAWARGGSRVRVRGSSVRL